MARAAGSGAVRHVGFLGHRGFLYLWIALALTAGAIALYAAAPFEPARNGGTWVGYGLGSLGAVLIVWLTLLGWRKRAITPGPWRLRGWLSAHVYLGLALLVVGTLHTGFQFGWNLHTLAYALMVVVIASGVVGVVAYARVPSAMSQNRAQTSQREMLDELAALDGELRQAAQPLPEPLAGVVRASVERTRIVRGLVQRLSGRVRACPTAKAVRAARAAVTSVTDARSEDAARVAAILERKQALLDRARRHAQLKAWLEVWLYVHVPVTFALIAALVAHVVAVFFYW